MPRILKVICDNYACEFNKTDIDGETTCNTDLIEIKDGKCITLDLLQRFGEERNDN